MHNTPGTILLAVALFLHSIGIISTEVTTIQELFPEYSYGMPPAEEVKYTHQFPNFDKFADKKLEYIRILIYKRDHIIFGWRKGVNYIKDLCTMFDIEDVYIVFNTMTGQWVSVSQELARKLGARGYPKLVFGRDKIVAAHKSTSIIPVYKEAHLRASIQAIERLDVLQREQLLLYNRSRTSLKKILELFRVEYSRVYDREFSRILFQHGEYNVNGYKEWHN